jgi:hypothetical protein
MVRHAFLGVAGYPRHSCNRIKGTRRWYQRSNRGRYQELSYDSTKWYCVLFPTVTTGVTTVTLSSYREPVAMVSNSQHSRLVTPIVPDMRKPHLHRPVGERPGNTIDPLRNAPDVCTTTQREYPWQVVNRTDIPLQERSLRLLPGSDRYNVGRSSSPTRSMVDPL